MRTVSDLSRKLLFSRPLLPHPALPDADWADCYTTEVTSQSLTAIEAAYLALTHFPSWARLLLGLRNHIVSIFGLKSSESLASSARESIGFFPVVSKSDHQVVAGFDDEHLDFRVIIDVVDAGEDRKLVAATTLVYRKILLGRIYIAVITPFHKLIVKAMLRNMQKRLCAVSSLP
ncbi:DUF2867 domain-containing protein [Neorhizobium lilium]|uniref:DUF2867 domain-containing protein n=1 Tax=Neorhizobium lilium TaxID=2503024 RepID=A0A3S3VIA1_9HYPH|nr:DUF2867 domain-containing protein [Neorhizobium lilium]RWX75166.1 DUF2867 domain-containing protein [Neorhizobium lilium]